MRRRAGLVGRALAVGLACAAGASAADPGKPPKPLPRAISGDMLEIDGRVMRLRGLDCPPFAVPEGEAAKRFLTMMLRAPVVSCRMSAEREGWVGDCLFAASPLVKPRSMRAEMAARNLCQQFGRA